MKYQKPELNLLGTAPTVILGMPHNKNGDVFDGTPRTAVSAYDLDE